MYKWGECAEKLLCFIIFVFIFISVKRNDWEISKHLIWYCALEVFLLRSACSILFLLQGEKLVHQWSGRNPVWSCDFTESGSLAENTHLSPHLYRKYIYWFPPRDDDRLENDQMYFALNAPCKSFHILQLGDLVALVVQAVKVLVDKKQQVEHAKQCCCSLWTFSLFCSSQFHHTLTV